VFVLIAAFMVYGPLHRQVLGDRQVIFRQWTMFSLGGVGLLDVRFSRRFGDGNYEPVDHYETLGHPDWRQAPLELRRVVGEEQFERLADELCAALGPGADLRARVRIATPQGWRTILMEADRSLCESS